MTKKRALVTGGSGAIGAVICQRLAADGYAVIVHAHRHSQSAEQVAEKIAANGGTASVTTFDVVDYNGAYKGGIIAPGINLSLDALVSAAAKLPRIAIEAPEETSVIGRTTQSQMLTGVYWGYVAMIEGLVARLKAEIGRPVTVIATGGLAPLFERHGKLFDAVEPDLTIQGLSLLYKQVAAR